MKYRFNPYRWLDRWLVVIGLLSLLLTSAFAVDEEELLDPDQAFALTVKAENADIVIAEWAIAEGYYLYRTRIKLASLTPGIQLGEPLFPAGKIKKDEFFGEMETYRHNVAVEIPILRDPDAPAQLELETISQGCADLGICYPPQKKALMIDLPAGNNNSTPMLTTNKPKLNLLAQLTQKNTGLNNTDMDAQIDPDLPPPEQAFITSITALDENTIRATWDINECCYLYKDKFSFVASNSTISFGEPAFPDALQEEDEFYGHVDVFRNKVSIDIPIQRAAGPAQPIDIVTGFQGCADIGVCYPPQQETIPVMLAALSDNILPPANAATTTPTATISSPPVAPLAEQDRMANLLTKQRFWAVPMFFLFGLALAFTPCVFPMVPILSSIIVGQGGNLTQSRAFLLSFIYVFAMALTYTIVGVLAGMFGQNIQVWFQDPWVLSAFAGVFVLLALSMFGFYELQLPSSWQSKLTQMSNSQRGGTYAGVAIMGFLSALIVGPCVAPPLIGALTVIGTTGDAVLGGAALFALSMGMGAPLLLIGTSAGKLLPRAGQWMDIVKAVFGVLLLAVAIWMLERILPEVIAMLLWATLLIVSAIYMGALQSTTGLPSWRMLSKGLGTVMLVYGILLLVGVAAGGRDTLQPLRGLVNLGNTPQQQYLAFHKIKSVADLDQQITQANGRPIMLDFYADWCISCKEMEKFTFSDPDVQLVMNQAVLLKADVTANDEADQALLKRFNLIGPPAILFFGQDGNEKPRHRVVGFMPASDFKTRLNWAFQSNVAKL